MKIDDGGNKLSKRERTYEVIGQWPPGTNRNMGKGMLEKYIVGSVRKKLCNEETSCGSFTNTKVILIFGV